MKEVGFRPRDCYGSACGGGVCPAPKLATPPQLSSSPHPPTNRLPPPGYLLRRPYTPGPEPSHLLTCPPETSLHRLLLRPGVQFIVTSTRRPSGLCEDRPSLSFLPPGPHARSLSEHLPPSVRRGLLPLLTGHPFQQGREITSFRRDNLS